MLGATSFGPGGAKKNKQIGILIHDSRVFSPCPERLSYIFNFPMPQKNPRLIDHFALDDCRKAFYKKPSFGSLEIDWQANKSRVSTVLFRLDRGVTLGVLIQKKTGRVR